MKYELTADQYSRLMEASKPVTLIAIQCGPVSTPRENAERIWRDVAAEHGCIFDTIQPSHADGPHFFRAEPIRSKNNG